MTIWLQSSDKIVTPAQLSGTAGVFSCNNTETESRGLAGWRAAQANLLMRADFQSGLRYRFRLQGGAEEKGENSS